MNKDLSKIHPELRPAAQNSPMLQVNAVTARLLDLIMPLMPGMKPPQDVVIENIVFQNQKDRTNTRLRIYRPKTPSGPMPVLLWLHGGGYVIGKPEIDDARCIDFVHKLGIFVISVDYRLAPKHPFPAALDDTVAAIEWIKLQAPRLGLDVDRVAIGGESAGGGLAAALVQLLRDRQTIKPVLQLLIYPMLDDRTVLQTEIDDSNNITWSHKNNRFGWQSYLGSKYGKTDLPVYSVPARRKDLSGLPPAWIGVGSLDIFHNENVAYAQRLQESNVACELIVVPGAFHGFERFAPEAAIVKAFNASQIAALRGYFSL